MRFWGKNRSGTGALSKHGFHPCPSIIRNSQRRTRECFLLLESTFLRVSRLATLFMHGLNTVFIFAALVMFCTFALPFWALFSQWPPPFLEGVSCALGVNDYVRFFTELGFFLYCYCCLSFSPSALSRFRFHFPRDNPFQLEFPLVDHLSMSSRTKSQKVNKNGGKESAERVFKLFCSWTPICTVAHKGNTQIYISSLQTIP